jgi:hypothetical protein
LILLHIEQLLWPSLPNTITTSRLQYKIHIIPFNTVVT